LADAARARGAKGPLKGDAADGGGAEQPEGKARPAKHGQGTTL